MPPSDTQATTGRGTRRLEAAPREPRASRFPDALVLIFGLIVAAQLATYVLPAGEFEREGRQVVRGTYHAVAAAPLPIFTFLTAVPAGLADAADIIFFILIVGGVFGVLRATGAVDALIGLSVAYKAFENLDGFRTILGWQPNPQTAVLVFGLAHGFGLATKLQDLSLSSDGLVGNIIAFNVGVEIGQLLALGILLVAINAWRAIGSFDRYANVFNTVLMFAGFSLAAYQMSGFFFAT